MVNNPISFGHVMLLFSIWYFNIYFDIDNTIKPAIAAIWYYEESTANTEAKQFDSCVEYIFIS
jgi:hypothetical protein